MPRPSKIAVNTVADQVALHLKEAILRGEYSNGEQLPSLAELAKEFGVSISSVREGLKKLEALELIEIVHGRGVFVRSAKIHWQGRFTNFSEMVRQWGKVPGAQVLESATLPASDEVAAQLNLSAGAPVHYLQRLRLADSEPLAIETSFLPAEPMPTFFSHLFPTPIYRKATCISTILTLKLRISSIVVIVSSCQDTLDAIVLVRKNFPTLVLEIKLYQTKDMHFISCHQL